MSVDGAVLRLDALASALKCVSNDFFSLVSQGSAAQDQVAPCFVEPWSWIPTFLWNQAHVLWNQARLNARVSAILNKRISSHFSVSQIIQKLHVLGGFLEMDMKAVNSAVFTR